MANGTAEAGKEVVREHGAWIETLARLGFLGRAAVYFIIGVFALRAAVASGQPIGTQGAIRTIVGAEFGIVLLWGLVVSLAGFALWRVVYAVMDPDRRGSDWKGWVVRGAYFLSAFVYAGLAVSAGRLALGLSSDGGGGPQDSLVGMAFEAGLGRWLTFAVAALLAGIGIAYVVRGLMASFEKYMRFPARTLPWLKWVCQAGMVARGLVFVLLGWLLYSGASGLSSNAAPGTEDALGALLSWEHGRLYLAALAVGLLFFAVFGLAQARYRRIDVENA